MKTNILLLGGSGYVGSAFLKSTNTGEEVCFHCLFRKKKSGTSKIKRQDITWIETDCIEKFDFNNFIRKNKIEYVLNFIGEIKGTKKSIYYVNYYLLKDILDKICLTGKVKCFIHCSTTATLLPNYLKGNYGRSKELFELYIAKSGIDYIILKPSAIYGGIGNDNLNKYIEIIKKKGICPIIGDGMQLIQPVEIDEVVHILDRIIRNVNIFLNKNLIIVRQEPLTLINFLKGEAEKRNTKLKYVNLPLILGKILIKLQESLFPKKPFILWEQVLRSRANRVFRSYDKGLK